MADSQHIFISYARNDGREYAARLDTDLTASGFRTWRDTRDIDPNQDFLAELEHAIAESSHVVCCITPDTRRDDSFVRREIGYALAVKKPVVPLVFENTLPPIHIINVTRINAVTAQWDQMIAELSARLHHADDHTYEQVTLPDDPYRDYLTALYDQIVRYLNLTVFSLITLRGEASPDAVEKKTANVLPMAFFEMAGIEADKAEQVQFNSFQEAFDKYKGRVLLLGEPGAGKTTTLFAFARDAVAARLNDPLLQLPILAPIATWDAKAQMPLTQWLRAQIPSLTSDTISRLLDTGKALLMLDGLDELGGERKDGITKERYDPRLQFMRLLPNKHKIILTCRVKDYADIGAKLAFQGAITLQPLSDTQMRDYLRNLPDLWVALETDNDLREIARTPLLLSLFTFAFRNLPEAAKQLQDLSAGDVRDKIFETYVRRRYEHERRKLNTNLPFELQEIYEVLGKVAMGDAGGGRNKNIFSLYTFSEVSRLQESKVTIFVEFMCLLNLLTYNQSRNLSFSHLQLRDYFAFVYAQRALFFDNPDTRDQAAWALWEIPDERAVPALISVLQDKYKYARGSAASALGRIGDTRAIQPLVNLLEDETHVTSLYGNRICDVAANALQEIGTPEALAAVEAWRKFQEGRER